MNYLAKWDEAIQDNFLLRFIDVLLKGYGQVLISLNSLTGLLFAAAILFLSKEIFLLTLLAVFSSSLTAELIRGRRLHINAGVYGFNGVVLGIGWLWFFKMTLVSIILLLFTALFSSILMKLLQDASVRTRTNLPVFSSISVILIWLILILIKLYPPLKGILGPDECVINYLKSFGSYFSFLTYTFALVLFRGAFYKHIIAFFIIFLAVRVHSRISAKVGLTSLFMTCITIYCLGGKNEFLHLDLYLYNAVPLSLALGGIFLVINRRTFLFTLIGVFIVNCLIFVGIRYSPLPIFVAPFNIVTIFVIWLVKANILKKKHGFYAVPMEFVSTPEFGIAWQSGEIYAEDYWQKIQDSLTKHGR